MMDDHRGLPHDLPRTKAKVYKDATFLGRPCWRWVHACALRGGVPQYSYPLDSHTQALAGALRHMEYCW
jgi:hypothetical protein